MKKVNFKEKKILSFEKNKKKMTAAFSVTRAILFKFWFTKINSK